MNTSSNTRPLPAPDGDDLPAQLLLDTWLLTIFAVLLATALPWFVSAFSIGFGAATLGILALGALYVAMTRVTGRRALAILHMAGVVLMALVWQHAGGLQNPLFLVAFVLPVIGASFISRWQPYLTAVVAFLAVTALTLVQAPELRWYAGELSTVGTWLAAALSREGTDVSAAFAGFYAPLGYYVVMLEVFATLLLACAVATEHLGTVFAKLRAQVAAARADAQGGHELWTTLLDRLPAPALLVDAETLEVIRASEQLAARLDSANGTSNDGDFLEALQFSYPDVVRELISGEGGVARPCMLRVADRLRAAEVRVQHLAHKGRRFALVIIDDVTEAFCVRTALDRSDHAALVVDAKGLVMAFNKPALALFPGIEIGAEASRLLSLPGPATRWWEPGLRGRRKMHMEIFQRAYQVTSSVVAPPGEEESINIVAFLPVARAAATSPSAIAATAMKPTLVGPR